jgi:hypothetical protein
MPPKKVDKVEAEMQRLKKLDENKSCADCYEKVSARSPHIHPLSRLFRCLDTST